MIRRVSVLLLGSESLFESAILDLVPRDVLHVCLAGYALRVLVIGLTHVGFVQSLVLHEAVKLHVTLVLSSDLHSIECDRRIPGVTHQISGGTAAGKDREDTEQNEWTDVFLLDRFGYHYQRVEIIFIVFRETGFNWLVVGCAMQKLVGGSLDKLVYIVEGFSHNRRARLHQLLLVCFRRGRLNKSDVSQHQFLNLRL